MAINQKEHGKPTIASLFLAVSWYLSMMDLTHGVSPVLYELSATLSQTFQQPLEKYSHIDIMCSGLRACFHHRSRVQMIRSHGINDELCLPDQRVQFFAVQLDGKNSYHNPLARTIPNAQKAWTIPGSSRSGFNSLISLAMPSTFCSERPANAHLRFVGRFWTICSAQ